MSPTLTIRRYAGDQLDLLAPTLLRIYRDVYADQLDEPFWQPSVFRRRLAINTAVPGCRIAVGYLDGTAVGYLYGFPVWPLCDMWQAIEPPQPPEITDEDGLRSFATMQLMIVRAVRGTDVALRIHEGLLVGRAEERIVGSVEVALPRLLAHYESWGYRSAGVRLPDSEHTPLIHVIVRPLRPDGPIGDLHDTIDVTDDVRPAPVAQP